MRKWNRHTIRLRGYDYCSNGIYFITLCTQDRVRAFGRITNRNMVLNQFGLVAAEEWLKTARLRHYVRLDEFIIMPDHMHGILIIENNQKNERMADGAIGGENDSLPNGPAGTTRRVVPNAPVVPNVRVIPNARVVPSSKSLPNGFAGTPGSGISATSPRQMPHLTPDSLGSIMGQYKSVVTKKLRKMGLTKFRWQRNYYERIIRDEHHLRVVQRYIKNNPSK